MTYTQIQFEASGGVAVLTLNRPDIRNAITGQEMVEEVVAVCEAVNRDETIKALILTATDPSFSSGGNLKDMAARRGIFAGTPADIMQQYRHGIQRIPRALHQVEVPTIAAVNGPAIGAGCDLALMCDMRIASDRAVFAESFVNVGLISGDGGAYFLPRLVGMARACQMTFTGEAIDAETALAWGLVNQVVPHAELIPAARALAGKIAAQPGAALRMSKRLLYLGQGESLDALLEHSAACQALCHHTEAHRQAVEKMVKPRKDGG